MACLVSRSDASNPTIHFLAPLRAAYWVTSMISRLVKLTNGRCQEDIGHSLTEALDYDIKNRMNKNVFRILLSCMAVSTAFAAEVGFISARISDTCASILFQGKIRPGDTKALAALIEKNDVGCVEEEIEPAISFDSLGGDMDESINIGRLIRSKGIGTSVERGAQCVSACNIAFLGGVSRSVDGVFGIHRPYTLELSTGESDALSKYEAIMRTLYSYAREMRVSQELFDRMTKISPQDVYYLSHTEMQALGVIGVDAVWEDVHMSREAKSLGISKREYIRRRASAKSLCGKGHKYRPFPDPCFDSVMETGSPPK